MITAIEGRPGQGKSVYLVSLIIRYLTAGYYVCTNVSIHLTGNAQRMLVDLHYIDSLDDLVNINMKNLYENSNWKGKPYKGIKVVLDEVQTYLNSRNWDKLDVSFQLLLQQHRKRGMDIVGATQSIKRADVVFRELVQVYYRIRKVVTFSMPYTKQGFGFFYLREYDPDDMESGGKKSNQESLSWLPMLFFADPYTMKVYDTTQEYKPTVKIGQRYVEEYVYVEKRSEMPQLVSKRKI